MNNELYAYMNNNVLLLAMALNDVKLTTKRRDPIHWEIMENEKECTREEFVNVLNKCRDNSNKQLALAYINNN